MAFKNTAITVCISVWNTNSGAFQTGDAANITVRGVGDGTEFTPASPSITEMDATNLPGIYKVSLAAGENNYSMVVLGGKSSTSSCVVQPAQWTNETNANLVQILGTVLTETAGLIAGGFKKFFNIATPAATMDHGILVDTATAVTNAVALTASERNSVADALLARSIAGGASTGRTVTQAIASLRNKVDIIADVLTVYAADDTTPLWEADVTRAAGNPLSAMDPTT